MDLPALLAREGIEPGDVEALLKWARQHSHALIARIEPGSPLAEMLGANLERVREPGAPVAQPAAHSAPRPIARSVSRPYLNAAVGAALYGKQDDLDLAIDSVTAEDDPPEQPVAAPEPEPEPEPEIPFEDDPSIGGFNRFAFAFRRRAAEAPPAEPPRSSASLSRGFELHAESQAPRSSWDDDDHVPEPPGFEARLNESARIHLANLDAESSGGLVLGIPDDDTDIPVLRGRPRSQSEETPDASSSMLTDAVFDALIEPSLLEPVSTDPDTDAPLRVPSGPHVTDQLDSGPAPAASGPYEAARPESGPAPAAAGPYEDARPESGPAPAAAGPYEDARPESGPAPAAPEPYAAAESAPVPSASGPNAADSGPHAAEPPDSAPMPAATAAEPSPVVSGPHASAGPDDPGRAPARPTSGPHSGTRTGPPPPPPARAASSPARAAPPPPPSSRRGGKKTEPQPLVTAPAKPANKSEGKKGKHRKKVVELSQPVNRPVSAPAAAARPAAAPPVSLARPVSAASREPSPPPTPAHAVPDYLRDDED